MVNSGWIISADGSIQRILLAKSLIFTIIRRTVPSLELHFERGFFYELVLYPSENLRCILPKINYPSTALRSVFDIVKRTCIASPFVFA